MIALAACGDSDPHASRGLSGVLITLDTTNAPALGVYGGRAGITPRLDALAAESLVYENARTVAPLTFPAHSSMLTGLYPPRHTVRDNGLTPLPESASTLAESARDHGYQTAAFIAAVVLAAPYGLNQGFETYDDPIGERVHERRAAQVTRAAVDWLKARDRDRPFFLWVHYFDAHFPHEPAPRYVEQVKANTQTRFPEYLAEIAQIDDAMGELLATLEEEGLFDTSLVAVVADHGESLYRHGEPTHSILAYDTTIRVPLFLRYPDRYRAGHRSDEIVSVIDLHPTFLEAFGLPLPEQTDGLSLYRRRVPEDRGVYFESMAGYLSCGWSPLSGFADAQGTYLHSSVPELYAAADLGQLHNLLDEDPARARFYRQEIARLAERPKLEASESRLDDEDRQRIQELGYLGGADPELAPPHPLETGDLPNPRDHITDLGRFMDASLLAKDGQIDEAIAELTDYLKTATNQRAGELLGQLLSKQGRFDEAIPILKSVTESGVPRRNSTTLLAAALEHTGQPEQARQLYLKAHQTWPDAPSYVEGLIRLSDQLGHPQEADRFRRLLSSMTGAAERQD